jgi:sarcosine oxidase subunit beta
MTGDRVIIIGGGLIGLSIARALTERSNSDVLVLERHSLASGGTGKSSGIVRSHYGVSSIAAMAWRSLPIIEKLGDAVSFRQVGYTVIVGEDNQAPLRAMVPTPGGTNVIASRVDVWLDVRHPQDATTRALVQEIRQAAAAVVAEQDCTVLFH